MAPATATQIPQEYLDEALNYRRLGGYRAELLDYLHRCGATEAEAEYLADRFDLELGMAGHPRPHDINPVVARQLDAHAALVASAQPAPATTTAPVQSASDIAGGAAQRHADGQPLVAAMPMPATTPPPAAATLAEALAQPPQTSPAPEQLAQALAPTPQPAAVPTPAAPIAPAPQPAPTPATSPEAAPSSHQRSRATSLAEAIAARQPQGQAPAAPAATPPPAPVPENAMAPLVAAPTTAPTTAPSGAGPNEGPQVDADWQETTDFGYRIAKSWDEDDPNLAINEATSLARAGKTQEDIIAHLLECNVSQGEAEYVARMTGARSAPKPKPSAKEKIQSTKNKSHTRAVITMMFVVGALLMYMGWSLWDEGAESVRSPLSLAAVGGALFLNGLRSLVRRR